MKKNTALVLFSSVFSTMSLFGGNYGYDSSCPNGNCNRGNNQNQYYNQGNQGYYQGQGNYQAPRNQQNDQRYNQANTQYNPSANQPYYQGQGSQGYYDNGQNQNGGYYDGRQGQGQAQGYYENNQRGQQYSDRDQVQTYGEPKNGSDQEIEKKIKSNLSSWFSNEYQNVSYDVNNGYVVLRGSVNTLEDKKKVEDAVRKIDGVKQINNQITVTV